MLEPVGLNRVSAYPLRPHGVFTLVRPSLTKPTGLVRLRVAGAGRTQGG